MSETRQGLILPGSPRDPFIKSAFPNSFRGSVCVGLIKSFDSLFTLVREVTLSDKLNSEELSFLALVQSHTDFVTGIVNMKIECVFV